MLEQSLFIVNSQQNSSNTLHSESEHFAITCDVNGVDIIKSPTIESMSGKSFDDNFSMQGDDIDVVHATFNVNVNNVMINQTSNSCSNNQSAHQNINNECIEHETLSDNIPASTTNNSSTNTTTSSNERIERKFERLSSQLDIDDEQLNSSQCQRDFDMAMKQVNSDELSNLQRDFSKISWDDSVSATTADMGALTPDNDIQDIPKGDVGKSF